ncbi:SpoIIE family protein phosphatase [Streptomyces meridianus]|uniref:SpoIIE family protein phosphatase n=1 Tax=Streptomyces meridianus TaxID=2938945 RepID=A0ABT0X940_9ACTN|nr:SpoIIE family protein phosphatase [Streptomyces meridianus]MCM2579058.1 SpoIIE family protein phosphatase [Streptomyces meridianus]
MAGIWDDVRALNRSYDRFLAGRPEPDGVRTSIATSWRRCEEYGLIGRQLAVPYEKGLDEENRLVRAATPVLDRLMASFTRFGVSAVLADDQARILHCRTTDQLLARELESFNIAPGYAFTEQLAGTNGIGTTLAERRPCYVYGREHFADCMEPFACAGAPVHDPISGRTEGVLDLTCRRADADPLLLALARECAADIEQRLLEEASRRERGLVEAFAALRTGPRPAAGALGPASPGTVSDNLDRQDRAMLREKAAELLAGPPGATERVDLPGGRVAVLRSRRLRSGSGEDGIAVEARIGTGSRQRHLTLTHEDAQQGSSGATAVPVPPARQPGGAIAPVAGDNPWLLLVGEQGVGRVALEARRRLRLLHDASVRIGTTLDVTRTAEELTEVAVPRFADFASVDLADSVLRGEEPVRVDEGLRRVALRAVGDSSAPYPLGSLTRFVPATPQARSLTAGRAVLEPALRNAVGWASQDPKRVDEILQAGYHSLIAVPVLARGEAMGVVTFLRSDLPSPFEDDDLALAEEVVGRAAICIDNARRYTREHTTALALQRSLLPRGAPEQRALDVAHRYLPAKAGVGGDWFDVIPLSGARVALVVGDVVGHGVHAAATMGRLRTAIHNFSALDLPADEVLMHLDDLVDRLDRDECAAGDHRGEGIIGATCLYAIYDPASGRCSVARAGHPAPMIVRPDGSVTAADVPTGAPLGLGEMLFEVTDLDVPEGSRLVLYTDGLVEDRGRDFDVGLAQLGRALAHCRDDPDATCDAVLQAMLPTHPNDDVALLVARTRRLTAEQTACWEVDPDPSVVADVRAAVGRQLEKWGLEHLTFSTELAVSELVTNAIRHAAGPIGVRLLRDHVLICEVSDGSSTSPRPRRAGSNDEGGRGLFLVSQVTTRWGTRYTATGKVIWAEQALSRPDDGCVAFGM